MSIEEKTKKLLMFSLGLDNKLNLKSSTKLLGDIPEFDSLAVVSVIEAIEDQFDLAIDDDEIEAEVFETFGSLVKFIEQKVA